MDIAKQAKKGWNKKWLLLPALVAVLGLGWGLQGPSAKRRVARADVDIATVQKGDFQVLVQGFGTLASARQRVVTAQVKGVVEQIAVRPGAQVKADTLLLTLSDPELEQQYQDAKLALEKEESALAALKLEQGVDLSRQRQEVLRLKGEMELAALEFKAKDDLAKKGVVSKLEQAKAKLHHEQLQRQWRFEKQRLEELADLLKQRRQIQANQVERLNRQLALVSDRKAALKVRAGLDGVLQSLPVEVGQSLQLGERLAQVGAQDEMLAKVDIPQGQAGALALGDAVDIDIRGTKVKGSVSRIEPLVKGGTIRVEVALDDKLPADARPQMHIQASIHTATLHHSLYVSRPTNAYEGQRGRLYRLGKDGKAQLVPVRFGAGSDEQIQILDGLKAGDRIIASDSSRWLQQQLDWLLIQ
ncbi:HlyD family efflux transporter periplasmic adaptor subunit [Gallaecimonas kandeliae]|uniref:efflux RND transporter periplasmic adaptor subunit n=1 Tax=Gallaecimonas kandeliae TaxID=3029055 RepID=UPI002648DCAC|nr:HlyD family efflux transporter periplasmic adaptor subunit [Gallaecimonas kandeliae]WKE65897.1 HlyD family efflux transporter periplasmic adaptor subunit [Gallaecimonas kandeliae]